MAKQDTPFINRYRDIILFIAIVILSLATIVIFRISYLKTFSPFSWLQRGVVLLADSVNQIGLNQQRLDELDYQYRQLLDQINIYEYATQLSGYRQRAAEQLNEYIGFSSTLTFDNIIARIVARDPNQIFNTFTIDRGARHGVDIDMPVIAIQDGRTGLVGRVTHVTSGSAIVQSIVDERNATVAEHVETQLAGIIRGGAIESQELTLDFIDARDIERVRPGDLIASSRFSSIYPPNIPIGRVQPFQRNRSTDQASITIMPILNFNRLNYVFVLFPSELFLPSAQ